MEQVVITALADQRRPHVPLSRSRLKTIAHLAARRIGGEPVEQALTLRPLRRFIQIVRLADVGAVPLIARLARGADKRRLVMDRTNWKIGERHVVLLLRAIQSRHRRV